LASKTQLERWREAERELETQLTKLRKQIRLAEHGQNARIKDANKYITRTNKMIARSMKEQSKIQEKELAKLEHFLGESFETLSEARLALSEQTRKATKRERLAYLTVEREKRLKRGQVKAAARIEREITGAVLRPERQAYTIRELSKIENQNIIDFLTDKKTLSEIGTGYLLPNERITISVPYEYLDTDGRIHIGHGRGKKVFQDWAGVQKYIEQGNSGIGPAIQDGSIKSLDWLARIEIIKFSDAYQAAIEKGRQTDIKNNRRIELRKHFAKKKRKEKAKTREKERALKAQIKAQAKEIKQLKGRK
jgi:hypothetical protein